MSISWPVLVISSTHEAQGLKTFYFGLLAELYSTEAKTFYIKFPLIFLCFYFCAMPEINQYYKEGLFIFVEHHKINKYVGYGYYPNHRGLKAIFLSQEVG